MSRTSALELKISKNGETLKTIIETLDNGGDGLTPLLSALHKTKQCTNDFLTTLVEADKQAPLDKGGVVVSHSKRKFESTEGLHIHKGGNELHPGSFNFIFDLQNRTTQSDKRPEQTIWTMMMMMANDVMIVTLCS